jgi:hypothetical protein
LEGSNWQNLEDSLKLGYLFSVECIQAEIDNYRLAHNLEQANVESEERTLLEHQALQVQSASDHKITGINWKSILFPGISMFRVVPPVLHIQLGATNYLDREIMNFIRKNIEEDLPDIHEIKMEIDTKKIHLSNCEREIER